jgi:hypothetical protein
MSTSFSRIVFGTDWRHKLGDIRRYTLVLVVVMMDYTLYCTFDGSKFLLSTASRHLAEQRD